MIDILSDSEIRESLSSVLVDLERMTAPGPKVLRMPDGSIDVSGNVRHMLRSLISSGGIDNVLRFMVINACERAEAMGPGSSHMLVGFLRAIVDNPGRVLIDQSIIASITKLSKPVTPLGIENVMRGWLPDVTDIILEAIELAGSECRIVVEPSIQRQTVVERVGGHTFRCNPDPSLYRSGKWSASDAKCLIIDGVVDSVSEIDALLERCNSDKRPMVIFARGYSKDVVSTLRVNHARRTLDVMPVTVEFDLETVNVLLDIATVVGSDVVSSLKGELISTIRFDDVPTIASVVCSGDSANIRCRRSPSIDAHINNIILKRSNETLPAIRQILDQRLRSLFSSTVVIRVDDSAGGKMMHEIDEGLRLVSNLLAHGVISISDVQAHMGDSPIVEILSRVSGTECPTSWWIVIQQLCNSLSSMLSTAKIAVVTRA